jgi:hypothetical protein
VLQQYAVVAVGSSEGIENIDDAIALVRPACPDGMCSLLAIWFGLKTSTKTSRSHQVGYAPNNAVSVINPSFPESSDEFTLRESMLHLFNIGILINPNNKFYDEISTKNETRIGIDLLPLPDLRGTRAERDSYR